jgi:hypothetical protein
MHTKTAYAPETDEVAEAKAATIDQSGERRRHRVSNECCLIDRHVIGNFRQKAVVNDNILGPATVIALSHDHRIETVSEVATDAVATDAAVSPGQKYDALTCAPERNPGTHLLNRPRRLVTRGDLLQ